MLCSHCGTALPPTAKFCPRCGAPRPSAPPVASAKATLRVEGPSGPVSYPLSPGTVTLGRTTENMIPLAHDQVSRRHAEIAWDARGCTVTDLGSRNGTYLNGMRLGQRQPEPLRENDKLQVGPFTLGIQFAAAAQPAAAPPIPATPQYAPAPLAPSAAATAVSIAPPSAASPPTGMLSLQGRAVIKIGRAPDNDVVVNHPQASRYHAIVEQAGGVVKITDLGSTNGTAVNGQRIAGARQLKDGDTVQIATYRFVLGAGQMQHYDDQGNISVDALHLNRVVGKGVKILTDVSLAIQPREFVAIVGGSGAGKSTLLDALNGFRPATNGAVLYNGSDLYQNYDAYRNVIGYVPQDDIIHRELTVYGALDYAAQIRLPRDTTTQERHQRIDEVLKDLGLEQRRDTPIGKLSGGQRKRASIGVELLTKPSLFYLDEPTSGLDPSTETKMMRLMRELADQGRTVILVTHVTGNVKLCDKVIIMARGGRVAFYGPPDDALKFFQVRDFVDIYDRIETGKPEDWQSKFEQSPQYQAYVAQPLSALASSAGAAARAQRAKPGFKRISALRQFMILSMRNLEILYRDKASLILMLMLAPLIGATDFLTWRSDLFNSTTGSATQVVTAMFMAGLITILVGGIASMREIVKEVEVYRRERMVGLGIVPYILSKVWLGVLLALYQALVLVIFKVVAIWSMPHDPGILVQMYITLTLATLSGMLMGLFVSAISPNQNVAPLLIILLLVPQFLFSGGLLPVNTLPGGSVISMATSTKWAFDSLVTISGMGKDVANDVCWNFDNALNDPTVKALYDQKVADGDKKAESKALQSWQDSVLDDTYKKQNCTCLGSNIFSKCSFPGIKDYYKPEVDQVEPAQPAKPGDPPAQPAKPPEAPKAPPPQPKGNQQDPAYQKQLQDWQKKFDQWNSDMTDWTNQMQAWRDNMDAYQVTADAYKAKTTKYQDDVNTWADADKKWKENHDKAIGNAEGIVRAIYDNYKDTLNANLLGNWSALGIIMGVFFILIFVAQKYKDTAGK